MAEPLEIDLDFRPNSDEAQQALAQFAQSAVQIAQLLSEALSSGAGLAQEISSINAGGLTDAADAVSQLQGVDLSGVQDAADALTEAAPSAEELASSLNDASDAAATVGSGIDIDPSGAEQLAQAIDDAGAATSGVSAGLNDATAAAGGVSDALNDAATAAAGVGDGLQLELFSAAADSAEGVADGLNNAASAAAGASVAAGDFAAELSAAGNAVDELATGAADTGQQLSLFEQSSERATQSEQTRGQTQEQNNEKTRAGVDLAGRLSTEFEAVQGKVGGLAGPMSRFTNEALNAVRALEGLAGLTAGGFAAGAAGLLVAGESYKKASDSIVLATGATGTALDDLRGSFDTALKGTGRSAGDVAGILATLNRDTGATGDQLAKLTDKTAGFLKVTQGGVGDVRSLTQVMNLLGLKAGDLTQFEDQLAAVTSHFGISISSLLGQIRAGGPALATLGFSPGQIAGLIGELDQAGLSITRLTPGFTKLSQQASDSGKTASEAFSDLIERIKGASSAQSALSEVQGVFSGRVAASFVAAVRADVIDINKLNEVLDKSPGTVSRLGDAVKGLGGQFGGIRNEILAGFGSAGLPFIEGLRTAIADIRPTVRALFDALSALTPAFRGFGEVVLLPVEGLRLLSEPLHLIANVLHAIPAPVLEAVGAFVALQLIPFGAIGTGIAGLASAVGGLGIASAGAGITSALGGLTAALAEINPVTIVAAVGIVGVMSILRDRAHEAEEMRNRIEALRNSLDDLSVASDAAGPKLQELLQSGSKGKLISDADLAALAKAGLSIESYRQLLQKAAADPNQDITKELRQSLVDSSGGIEGLIERFGNFSKSKLASEFASTADGAHKLTEEFVQQGTIMGGQLDKNLQGLIDSYDEIGAAEEKRAAAQINQLLTSKQVSDQDVTAAVQSLHLKDAKDGEAAVYEKLIEKVNAEKLAKAGLSKEDAAADQRRADMLASLEDEGASRDAVAKKTEQQSAVLFALADASRNGLASDADRIRIMEQTGVDAKTLGQAEEQLLQIQAKYPESTSQMDGALQRVFASVGAGKPTFDALRDASLATGAALPDLAAGFDALNSKLQEFAPPVKVSDEVMTATIEHMRAGAPIQSTFADLLQLSGGNAEVALAALQQYKTGVDDTQKALLGLVPTLADTVKQLQEVPKAGEADNRGAAFEAEKQSITALAALRDQDLASQQAHLVAARDLAVQQAAATGQAFDPSALDAQIGALQTARDAGSAQLGGALAEADGAKGQVLQAVADAQGGILQFGDVLTTFDATLNTGIASAQQAAELRAQGLTETLKIIFDPNSGFSKADQAKFLNQISTMSGDEKTALEAHSKEVTTKQDQLAKEVAKTGDIFADQNPEHVAHAEQRGREVADGLKTGVIGGLSDSRLNEIISVALESGVDPAVVEKVFHDKGLIGGKGLNNGVTDGVKANALDPVGVSDAMLGSVAEQMGIKGAAGGANFNTNAGTAAGTPLDPVAVADAAFAGVTAQMGSTGAAGGANFNTNAGAAASTPLDPVAVADAAFLGVNVQLGPTGTAGGLNYNANAAAAASTPLDPVAVADAAFLGVNVQLGPTGAAGGLNYNANAGSTASTPLDPGIAGSMTGPVGAQMNPIGQDHGSNYNSGVGSTANQPVPIDAGTLVGHVDLFDPGFTTGTSYPEGVAAGIRNAAPQAIEEAYAMANQVDAAGRASIAAASPSKKGIKLGGWYVEGVALGIEAGIPRAVEAAGKIAAITGVALGNGGLGIDIGGTGSGMDGPGFDRVVNAVARLGANRRPRRRQPFGGMKVGV